MMRMRGSLRLLVVSCIGLLGCAGPAGGGGPNGPGGPVVVRVAPTAATLEPGATQVFTATVTGAAPGSGATGVRWSASGGRVVPDGARARYTAPDAAGDYTVTATSEADSDAHAEARVTVTNAPGGDAPALRDTVAYVRGDTGDEIRAVAPDGSNDRLLWTHGQNDPHGVHEIWDLAWSPDARALAFASTHENHCSLLHADVYAVASDGSDYRRLSGPPACAALGDFPHGTVRLPVVNRSALESVLLFVYFLGAPGVQQVSLPPGGSGELVFEGVADFGDGVIQFPMMIHGANREVGLAAAVDVRAGETVVAAPLAVSVPTVAGWEARAPSWHAGGDRVAYAYSFHDIYAVPPHPAPLELGDALVAPEGMPSLVNHLAWGPPARADELLYAGWDFDASRVLLLRDGDPAPGEALLTFASFQTVLGLAWLPDGSGFVVALREDAFEERSDLFAYDFASGETRRLTDFAGEFAGRPSVSPDGREVAFERAAAIDVFGSTLLEPDLWVLTLEGGALRPLVDNARLPAWSR